MNGEVIAIIASIGAILCLMIVVLQILLTLGKPYGALTMGGKFTILPLPLRIVSGVSAVIIGVIGYLLLQQSGVFPFLLSYEVSSVILWVFTIYLGINVLGNLLSKSKWERRIMTPIAGVMFVVCLVVSVYSTNV